MIVQYRMVVWSVENNSHCIPLTALHHVLLATLQATSQVQPSSYLTLCTLQCIPHTALHHMLLATLQATSQVQPSSYLTLCTLYNVFHTQLSITCYWLPYRLHLRHSHLHIPLCVLSTMYSTNSPPSRVIGYLTGYISGTAIFISHSVYFLQCIPHTALHHVLLATLQATPQVQPYSYLNLCTLYNVFHTQPSITCYWLPYRLHIRYSHLHISLCVLSTMYSTHSPPSRVIGYLTGYTSGTAIFISHSVYSLQCIQHTALHHMLLATLQATSQVQPSSYLTLCTLYNVFHTQPSITCYWLPYRLHLRYSHIHISLCVLSTMYSTHSPPSRVIGYLTGYISGTAIFISHSVYSLQCIPHTALHHVLLATLQATSQVQPYSYLTLCTLYMYSTHSPPSRVIGYLQATSRYSHLHISLCVLYNVFHTALHHVLLATLQATSQVQHLHISLCVLSTMYSTQPSSRVIGYLTGYISGTAIFISHSVYSLQCIPHTALHHVLLATLQATSQVQPSSYLTLCTLYNVFHTQPSITCYWLPYRLHLRYSHLHISLCVLSTMYSTHSPPSRVIGYLTGYISGTAIFISHSVYSLQCIPHTALHHVLLATLQATSQVQPSSYLTLFTLYNVFNHVIGYFSVAAIFLLNFLLYQQCMFYAHE
ncbi:hypothetical protein J6590_029107 [Homalodisca vitripennis]|nr:hypothetical protein J6590_029107 [Homalodisca vitripennis]